MCRSFATRRSIENVRPMTALCVSLVALLASPARASEPKPAPQRFFPARATIAYLEFDGLAAHTDAWHASAAYAMLAGTPAGAMMNEVAQQVTDRLLKLLPGGTLSGADVVALHDHLVQHGFAIALHRHSDDVSSFTVVLNGIGRRGTRERFDRLLALTAAPEAPAKPQTPTRLRGRDVYQLSERVEATPLETLTLTAPPANAPPAPSIPWLSWWFEKDDLVLISVSFSRYKLLQDPASGKRVAEVPATHLAAVLDTLEGKQPSVITHPAYVAATSEGADIKGFESDGLFFIDPGQKGRFLQVLLEGGDAFDLPGIVAGAIPGLSEDSFRSPAPRDPDRDAVIPAVVPTRPAPAPADGVPAGLRPPGVSAPPADFGAVPARLTIAPPIPIAPRPAAPAMAPRPLASPSTDLAALPAIPPAPIPPSQPVKDGQAGEANVNVDLDKLLGLEGVGRIVGRWGFQGKGLLTDVRVEALAPRTGLVGLLDQPAFDKDQLPPIPRAAGSFVVDAFDLAAVYGRIVEAVKTLEPAAGGLIDQLERASREATGLRLREDVLGQFGSTWCVLPVPTADGIDAGKGEIDPTGYALVGSLKDADGFSKTLDVLAERANRYLHDRERPGDGQAAADVKGDKPVVLLERLPAPYRGYRLTSPARLVLWLNEEIQPAIVVGKSSFAVAVNMERAREALAFELGRGTRWRPSGELAKSFECLPAKLTFLAVGDPRNSAVPGLIAGLPGLVQLLSTGLASEVAESSDLLTLIGIPGANEFRLRLDADKIPKEEDLQAHLFPSVLAAAVDGRGIRFISREAFPLACNGNGAYFKSTLKWGGKGLQRDLKLGWKWRSGG